MTNTNTPTYFRLPNSFTATIEEGTYQMDAVQVYFFMLTVRNACNKVDLVYQCPTLADCMSILAEY